MNIKLSLGDGFLSSKIIAFLEDVVGQVIDGVGALYTPHVDHALSQYRDDSLHQELAHVQLVVAFQLLHVTNNAIHSAVL